MTSKSFATIDEYLAGVPSEPFRQALSDMRAIIREEAPESVECISYGIPTVKLNGAMLSFAAFKRHCSFFPGHTVRYFTEQLSTYKTSAGTIQFTPDNPIPESLVRAIVRARFWPPDDVSQ